MSAVEEPGCQVCGSTLWRELPSPAGDRSVTTAGGILEEPLGKAQCGSCGFVQRIHRRFLGLTDHYERDYADYYERPAVAPFHAQRYRVLVELMTSALGDAPTRILDAGCGQGGAMEAVKAVFPAAMIEGLDPSAHNVSVAREKGFVVYENKADDVVALDAKYDFVYSNSVFQHVTDARAFLGALKNMVTEDGAIIITCPDGSVPNVELLWADQNFSFLPAHIVRLGRELGFETVEWFAAPSSLSMSPAQMVFLSKSSAARPSRPGDAVLEPDPEGLYAARVAYLSSFGRIDAHLCSEIEGSTRVINFGASYWSSVLAANCPEYWRQVSACAVEGSDGSADFLGKSVLDLNALEPTASDVLALGTNPATHAALVERLSPVWEKVVAWDAFLPR